jgi:hypothetical protein
MASPITQKDKQLAEEFVEQRKQLILQLQQSKGLKASGVSATLLHTAQPKDGLTQLIDGSGYFEFQDFGRSFGKFPPFKAIYEWLAFKKYGLQWSTEKQRRSLAWAIMISIAKKGTHTFRNKPTGVLTEAINEQSLKDLISKMVSIKGPEIASEIKRIF